MNKPRPRHLDLFTIALPIGAVVSILHRITGVVLFLLLPVVLYAFQISLSTTNHYKIESYIYSGIFKFFIVIWVMAYFYHLLAGLRLISFDLHLGTHRLSARRSAFWVLVLGAVGALMIGVLAW